MNPAQERNRLRIAAHNGKADPQYQRDQVAQLVSYVERIVHKLPEADQLRLRPITNQTCAAFGMPSIAERADIEVERYPNPSLPGGFGFHAFDDGGHHAFALTRDEALVALEMKR